MLSCEALYTLNAFLSPEAGSEGRGQYALDLCVCLSAGVYDLPQMQKLLHLALLLLLEDDVRVLLPLLDALLRFILRPAVEEEEEEEDEGRGRLTELGSTGTAEGTRW